MKMIKIYRLPTEEKNESITITPIHFKPEENKVYLFTDTVEKKKILIEAKIFNNSNGENRCSKCFFKKDMDEETTMCRVNCYEYLKDKYYYFERISKYQELFLGIDNNEEDQIKENK